MTLAIFYSTTLLWIFRTAGSSQEMPGMRNAKADKRCLALIGRKWDALLANMQMQGGKAPIPAQNPTAAAPEHQGTVVTIQVNSAHSSNSNTALDHR